MKTRSPTSRLMTSESVSPGHPDKLADAIADAVLDACLGHDHNSRVACEVVVTGNHVIIAGETTSAYAVEPNLHDLVSAVTRSAGYADPAWGFDARRCEIQNLMRRQSPDIAQCVNGHGEKLGAGDQGVMFGYATIESRDFMPLPIHLAHRFMRSHAALARSGRLPWLGPDAKTQVTVAYQDGLPKAIHSVVLSTQHRDGVSQEQLCEEVIRSIVKPALPASLCGQDTRYFINPSGRFVIGGPAADTGLTGRKNVVDSYGSACAHGGGSYSGKDPTKVDRSGAYMARYIAKNIVAAGIAGCCTVQLAYAIGQPEPIAVTLDTHNSHAVDPERLGTVVHELFDLTPLGIIHTLSLDRPIYRPTATLGHFGRLEPGFTWERLDRMAELRRACGLGLKPTAAAASIRHR
ncbi:MAG: methionine adenosyltransferase [Planctomycetes bacterium]|nr:methionine adenosyltransferase [Planctomycetota bacterium]